MAPEGEMAEGFGDFDDEEEEDFHFDLDKGDDDFDFEEEEFEPAPPREARIKHPHIKDHESHGIEDMLENIFSESKVDSILKGYFKIEENEKRLVESKKRQTKLISENKKTKINKIKQLSESISQEVGARKLMEKYPNAKLVGKTNKQNLVFEMNDEQLRVNTKGQII
jgi:hypothetical protein